MSLIRYACALLVAPYGEMTVRGELYAQPLQSEHSYDLGKLCGSKECGNSADFQGSATEESCDGIRHLTGQHSRHIVILP